VPAAYVGDGCACFEPLEGAMLVARPYGDLQRFNAAANQLLASLRNTDQASQKRRAPAARP
jgi:hypothetical protein